MDSPQLAILIPTRGRPTNVLRLAAALKRTCNTDPIVYWINDQDEPTDFWWKYGKFPATFYPGDHPTLAEKLNYGAAWAINEHPDLKAIAFMGDDHYPRTAGWDGIFLSCIDRGHGYVWGNDLIQGRNIATAVCISTEVYLELGWYAQPTLDHLFIDNVWTDLANATSRAYLNDVVIEHLHRTTGQAKMDDTYIPGLYEDGAGDQALATYREWRDGDGYKRDVARLRRLFGMPDDQV